MKSIKRAKEKLKMRAGETDKARSFKDQKLFDLIANLVEKIGYEYMIDTTDKHEVGEEVGLLFGPEDIHIMSRKGSY